MNYKNEEHSQNYHSYQSYRDQILTQNLQIKNSEFADDNTWLSKE